MHDMTRAHIHYSVFKRELSEKCCIRFKRESEKERTLLREKKNLGLPSWCFCIMYNIIIFKSIIMYHTLWLAVFFVNTKTSETLHTGSLYIVRLFYHQIYSFFSFPSLFRRERKQKLF